MNCSQANKLSIRKVLQGFSLFPSKENSRKAFYYAIDREERTPSLHVDFQTNLAYDYASGKTYDIVSIVQAIKSCSVSEALEHLAQNDFSSTNGKGIALKKEKKPNHSFHILENKTIQHPALIKYLQGRGITNFNNHITEIRYMNNGKKYFGIAFINDSKGYEIRNKYAKLCIGIKDVTTFVNGFEVVRVFEGFFDFLSFLECPKFLQFQGSDYIILNSVSMSKRIGSYLSKYEKVELYFDNDGAGNYATEEMKSQHSNVYDNRLLYQNHNDLNEFLIHEK